MNIFALDEVTEPFYNIPQDRTGFIITAAVFITAAVITAVRFAVKKKGPRKSSGDKDKKK